MFSEKPKLQAAVQVVEQGLRLFNDDAGGHGQAYGGKTIKELPAPQIEVVEVLKSPVVNQYEYELAKTGAEAMGIQFPAYDPNDPSFQTKAAMAAKLVLERVSDSELSEIVRGVVENNSVYAEIINKPPHKSDELA